MYVNTDDFDVHEVSHNMVACTATVSLTSTVQNS